MTDADLWLGPPIPELLQALRSAGLRIGAFQASPESFGSWYVDVGSWWRPFRVVGDGKEHWIVVQASRPFGDWKDLRSWRSIGQVIETLKNRKP
jgi:hypothetical protein